MLIFNMDFVDHIKINVAVIFGHFYSHNKTKTPVFKNNNFPLQIQNTSNKRNCCIFTDFRMNRMQCITLMSGLQPFHWIITLQSWRFLSVLPNDAVIHNEISLNFCFNLKVAYLHVV